MSYRPSAEEIACDLPTGAGAGRGTKAQLLLVAEILRLFTDEDHGLTADEIREVVGIRTGRTPTAAKVRDDIHALADSSLFGMDVFIPKRGEAGGFRCRKTFLSSEDARLAINMVRTCKFVTRQQRDRICEELFGMVSYYQQDSISRSVVVDERDLPSSPDVFAAAEAFSAAIESGRMLEFQYAARGLDGNEHLSENPQGDGNVFAETPISLIYSFGSYYAETWLGSAEHGKRMLRRLDRIKNASVSMSPAVESEVIDELRQTVQARIGQTFDMFDGGETRDLFLRVSAWAARYVYDRFGHKTRFEYISENESYGYVHIRVKPAATFYRWLFGMGDQIVLVRPEGTLWEEAFWDGADRGRHKTHEELVADYEYAIGDMKRQMEEFADAYGWKVERVTL